MEKPVGKPNSGRKKPSENTLRHFFYKRFRPLAGHKIDPGIREPFAEAFAKRLGRKNMPARGAGIDNNAHRRLVFFSKREGIGRTAGAHIMNCVVCGDPQP